MGVNTGVEYDDMAEMTMATRAKPENGMMRGGGKNRQIGGGHGDAKDDGQQMAVVMVVSKQDGRRDDRRQTDGGRGGDKDTDGETGVSTDTGRKRKARTSLGVGGDDTRNGRKKRDRGGWRARVHALRALAEGGVAWGGREGRDHALTTTRFVCLPARRRSAYGIGRRHASSGSPIASSARRSF